MRNPYPSMIRNSTDFFKVKFDHFTLDRPPKLPVTAKLLTNPVIPVKTNNNVNNTTVTHSSRDPPSNVNVTNVEEVTKVVNAFEHNGDRYANIIFKYKRTKLNISFENFVNFYPKVMFLQDYDTGRGPPPIVKEVVDFINKKDVTQKDRIKDIKKIFKLFLMKDICIFKILGDIKKTSNVERVRNFLKKKIKKYLDDKKTIDEKIWESSNFSNMGGMVIGRRWDVVYESGLLSDEQLIKIATHKTARLKLRNIYNKYVKHREYLKEAKKAKIQAKRNAFRNSQKGRNGLPRNLVKIITNKINSI